MKPVYRDRKVHVQGEKCSTCIFRPGNPMYLDDGRVKSMVDQCLEDPAGNIPCHQTLDGDRAICRGFWDGYADRQPVLRLAKAMNIIEYEAVKGGDH